MYEDNNHPESSSSEYRYVPERNAYTPPEYTPEPPKKKKKKGLTAGKVIAIALCCSLLGGLFGAGGVLLLGRRALASVSAEPESTSVLVEGSRPTSTIQTVKADTGAVLGLSDIYNNNVGSTVGITTSITTNFWGYQTTSAASGSGFILSSDGYILTNYHVIEDSSSISVAMYDGSSYDAELIGYDNTNDIAVLKIEAENLVPVVLGSSDTLHVGDTIVAIGNPLGELTFSLTSGVVSALDREITLSNIGTMKLIQTDCAINSGNSGGALFNDHGEVIGITNAKYSGDTGTGASIDNICFAIPIDSVRGIVENIIENGYFSKPYIGISTSTVSDEMKDFVPAGVIVKSIVEDGPASASDLQINDIITAVDGVAVEDSSALAEIISNHRPGDVLQLQVYRNGSADRLTVSVTVGEQKQSALPEPEPTQVPQQGQQGQQMQPYSGDPFDFFNPWSFFGF